ncbi:MAG: Gfo/Idh/MocA family protein [Candidatus Zipacnadales bacterium]
MYGNFTRRRFLKQATRLATGIGVAMAADGLELLAARQADAQRPVGANERLVAGFVGMGGMGNANLSDFLRCPEVKVAAVCDVDANRAAAAAKRVGEQCAVYGDYRHIIERDDIDIVVISTPDHWHALPAIHACEAGKDVYCEKPMSLTIKEGRAMCEAAERYSRVTQVGTQQRGGMHFQRAVELVQSGALGRISLTRTWIIGHSGSLGWPEDRDPPPELDWDMWLGPAPYRRYNPVRCHGSFRFFWDTAGGTLTDWGTHLMDVIHWGMQVDAPLACTASGGKYVFDDCRDTPDTQEVMWDYPGFTALWSLRQGNGYPFWFPESLKGEIQQDNTTFRPIGGKGYGMAFYGENGTLFIDREGWIIYPEGDRMQALQSGGSEQHYAHVRDFIECVKTREQCRSNFETAHRSTTAPNLGNIAYLTGRKIRWDREKEQIVDDPDADRLTGRAMRPPWHL